MNENYPYTPLMLAAALVTLLEDIDNSSRIPIDQKALWEARSTDAFGDLVEGKWPVARQDDAMWFTASSKDGAGRKSRYMVSHAACTCQAAQNGNVCRHRARRRLIMILEANFLPLIQQAQARAAEPEPEPTRPSIQRDMRKRVSVAQAEAEVEELWSPR